MTQQNENFVKILFKFFSDVLGEWTVEKIWAETIDSDKGLYRIDNIPFYASIASDDIVLAEYDETEKMLTYRETIEYSGNSIVQVVVMDKSVKANNIREIFNSMGCNSEKLNEGYFVLEIPAPNDYEQVKQKLTELENNGFIGYAEPVLSYKHQY